MISNYKMNKGIFDLRKGPITDVEDFRQAIAGKAEWENVRIYRELSKIRSN